MFEAYRAARRLDALKDRIYRFAIPADGFSRGGRTDADHASAAQRIAAVGPCLCVQSRHAQSAVCRNILAIEDELEQAEAIKALAGFMEHLHDIARYRITHLAIDIVAAGAGPLSEAQRRAAEALVDADEHLWHNERVRIAALRDRRAALNAHMTGYAAGEPRGDAPCHDWADRRGGHVAPDLLRRRLSDLDRRVASIEHSAEPEPIRMRRMEEPAFDLVHCTRASKAVAGMVKRHARYLG